MKAEIKNILRPVFYKFNPNTRNKIKKIYQTVRGINLSVVETLVPDAVKLDNQTAHYGDGFEITGDISCIHNFKKSSIGHDIICFPVIDWDFRVQRPQQLAKELGKTGSRIIYLTTTFNVSSKPGFNIEKMPCENVVICRLNICKFDVNIYKDKLDSEQVNFIIHGLYILRLAFGFGYTNSLINLPFWREVAEGLSSNNIIYDCMDHHAGFENNDHAMLNEEIELFKSSDLVITTAQRLSESVSHYRENIIIRNGCEVDYFSKTPESIIDSNRRPVIGYYGAIAEWFDVELLIECAKAYPHYDFVLIGATTCDIAEAKKLHNVKFLGEVPYKDLTLYLKDFDVCLIPFKLIELTLCTNPVKVYEYLAAGKPVVCTAMPEVIAIEEVVHVAFSHQDFIEKIDIALNESKNSILNAQRRAWAKNHDWHNRALILSEEINKINKLKPKVSLIILTYNNIDLTINCLDSIEKNTEYDNYEVIIVDNLSNDGTQEYLMNRFAGNDKYTIILNDKNFGFAGGNNIGLEHANGDILVVLNNDTYVGPFWLGNLVKALKRNPKLGLVGPVTNNIGNESKINISYKDWSDLHIKSLKYIATHPNELYPMDCLAFFCVAIRKSVYSQVGPISLDYGLGFFEDDDYCKRVKEAGWAMAAVEDSFVHHHLSASFNKLKNNKKEELMRNNKAIFEKKWGKWIPHSYRPGVE